MTLEHKFIDWWNVSPSFIDKSLQSCASCWKTQFGMRFIKFIVNFLIKPLMKYAWNILCYDWFFHSFKTKLLRITYYHCKMGWELFFKTKQDFKKFSLVQHGRKKKSFKCNCGFLLKIMVPISFSQSLNCDPKNKPYVSTRNIMDMNLSLKVISISYPCNC